MLIIYVGILRKPDCFLLAYAYFIKVVLYYRLFIFTIIILTRLGIIIVKRPKIIIWMGRSIRNKLLYTYKIYNICNMSVQL